MKQEKMVFQIQSCSAEPGDTMLCPDDLDDWIEDVSIEVWIIHEKIFFSDQLNVKPILHTLEFKGQSLMDPYKFTEEQLYLRENQADSYENLLLFDALDEYKFYDIDKEYAKHYPIRHNDASKFEKQSLYQTVICRDNTKILHERNVYGFLDLLGDLGGVLEIVLLAFGVFLSGISEFQFNIKSIQKLYKAKTKQ